MHSLFREANLHCSDDEHFLDFLFCHSYAG